MDVVPWTMSVMMGDTAKLEALLTTATAADLNTGDAQAALRLLSREDSNCPLVRRFIAAGADVNYVDCSGSGSTPLASACHAGALAAARMLVTELGADVHVRDDAGETALSGCTTESCAALLRAHGALGDAPCVRDEVATQPPSRIVTAASAVADIMARERLKKTECELTPEARSHCQQLNDQGVDCATSGDTQRAFELFSEALETWGAESFYANATRAAMALGRITDAERLARTRVTLYDDSVDALCTLGLVYEMEERDDDAEQCYTLALELDSECDAAVEGLGEIRHRRVLHLPNVTSISVTGDGEGGFSAQDLAGIMAAMRGHFIDKDDDDQHAEG